MRMPAHYALYAALFCMIACGQQPDKTVTPQQPADTTIAPVARFVNPPIPTADVPYQHYTVQAAKGDTLVTPSGDVLLFPANAFVDKNGQVITGPVDVQFREFKDPLDFYLAGIPMNYDSAGKAYQLESYGMFDVRAYKDNQPVFVNPKSKPEFLRMNAKATNPYDTYYLDTAQGKWVNKGQPTITNRRELASVKSREVAPLYREDTLIEPVKPEKANGKQPVLEVQVDPVSWIELRAYDKLKFQLLDGEAFDPKDSDEEWTNVELKEGKKKGQYRVVFSNARKTVSYEAKPVLEGKDYEEGMKVYEDARKLYERFKNDRIAREKYTQEMRRKDTLDAMAWNAKQAAIVRMNVIIEARNREIDKRNALVDSLNKDIERRNREGRIRRKQAAEVVEEAVRRIELFNNAVAGFQLDGFGYWNCDAARKIKTVDVVALYKGSTGKTHSINRVAMAFKDINTITSLQDANILKVVEGTQTMIFGEYNGLLAYCTYKDFAAALKGGMSIKLTLKMVSRENNNYLYLKNLMKQELPK